MKRIPKEVSWIQLLVVSTVGANSLTVDVCPLMVGVSSVTSSCVSALADLSQLQVPHADRHSLGIQPPHGPDGLAIVHAASRNIDTLTHSPSAVACGFLKRLKGKACRWFHSSAWAAFGERTVASVVSVTSVRVQTKSDCPVKIRGSCAYPEERQRASKYSMDRRNAIGGCRLVDNDRQVRGIVVCCQPHPDSYHHSRL